jgi:hypothetical protein
MLSLVFLVAAVAAQTVEKPSAQGKRIHGILLAASGQPEANTEVLLVDAQVWDLSGKPVPALPAKGTSIAGVIGDDSGGPIVKGRTRTMDGGRFEFSAPAGRYGVAVSNPGGGDAALLQSQQNRPVVFDVADAPEVNLGSVSRKKE